MSSPCSRVAIVSLSIISAWNIVWLWWHLTFPAFASVYQMKQLHAYRHFLQGKNLPPKHLVQFVVLSLSIVHFAQPVHLVTYLIHVRRHRYLSYQKRVALSLCNTNNMFWKRQPPFCKHKIAIMSDVWCGQDKVKVTIAAHDTNSIPDDWRFLRR